MQLPIGFEGDFEAVVDLLTMKAYHFEGEMGNVVVEKEIAVAVERPSLIQIQRRHEEPCERKLR